MKSEEVSSPPLVEVLALGRDLTDPRERPRAIRRLGDRLGVDDFVLFTPDPELGRLLPAPGFPQTLPNGRAWQTFLRRCLEAGSAEEVLPFPGRDSPSKVRGEVVEDSVLALVGGQPSEPILGALRLALPILLVALKREREVGIAQNHATAARNLAREHGVLALALDQSQRDLQQALQETHRAQERAAFLAMVSETLSASLDLQSIVNQVSALAVPRVADRCWVELAKDAEPVQNLGGLSPASAPPPSPRESDNPRALIDERSEPDHSDAEGTPEGKAHLALPGLDPIVLSSGDLARLYPTFQPREQPPEWASLDLSSLAIAPLRISERTLGTLVLARNRRRPPFVDGDVALVGEFARRVALSLDNALLYQQATDAIHVREEFLSIAAHELKTPITAVRATAQLMMRYFTHADTVDLELLRRYLESIVLQSHRLGRLVEQLLDVTRLETGRLTLAPVPTDLSQLVAGTVEHIRLQFPGRAIVVETPTVVAVIDPLRIEQIVINLIDNALKYSPPEAEVDVRVGRENEVAFIGVRDHGTGIPEEHRGKIFDRFYRATSDTHHTGLGLGLYISRQIVELHGGTLTAEFPSSGGSYFIARFPMNRD